MESPPIPTKLVLIAFLLVSFAACYHDHDNRAPMAEEEVAPPTNRIDVPLVVRQNLGITFATVERRAVADTVRYPGVFELKSTARHEYAAPASGRVEVLVEDYQYVEPGTPLFRISSTAWIQLQQQMAGAMIRADAMKSQIESHEEHRRALQDKLRFWQEHLSQLDLLRESAAAQWGEIIHAKQNIADTQAAIADGEEKHYEMLREAVPYLGAHGKGGNNPTFELALNEASGLLGTSAGELLREIDGQPRWRTIDTLQVVALNGGRVEPIPVNSGALVDNGSLVVAVTDPNQLRFRAKALQSDLSKLQQGATVRIVPLVANSGEALQGTLTFGLEADPAQRTLDLVIGQRDGLPVSWARPGVAAVAEVVIAGGGAMELAVPESAVISDGIQRVLFRRAPDNPNQVIRLEADAGVSDGHWIEILSGLSQGDEVVLGGVYELMLGSSVDGARQVGGHFHGDGTFHEAH